MAMSAGAMEMYDEARGFGYDCPPGWTTVAVKHGVYRITPPPELAAGLKVTIRIHQRSSDSPKTLMETLLAVHDNLAESGGQLTKMGPTTVAGTPALFANHTLDAEEGRPGQIITTDHVVVAVDRGPNRYVITATGPHAAFAKGKQGLKRILNSWRFERPAKKGKKGGRQP